MQDGRRKDNTQARPKVQLPVSNEELTYNAYVYESTPRSLRPRVNYNWCRAFLLSAKALMMAQYFS